jgi:ribosomal protein S27AE
MDLEQVSRLDSGYYAHEKIVSMIENGSDLNEIKQHCLIMMNASKKQLQKILSSNERESDRKHEGKEEFCPKCNDTLYKHNDIYYCISCQLPIVIGAK